MLIAAVHTIHNPKEFWDTARAHLPQAPEGIRILQIAPSTDGRQATCLWFAPTVDELHDWIYGLVGHVSENDFFEVHRANGHGLPTA